MVIRAYDEVYLPTARNTLGHMIDFAVMSLDLDPDVFGNLFAVSGVSKQFANGNPRYVAGMNGCEHPVWRCGRFSCSSSVSVTSTRPLPSPYTA